MKIIFQILLKKEEEEQEPVHIQCNPINHFSSFPGPKAWQRRHVDFELMIELLDKTSCNHELCKQFEPNFAETIIDM